ncbi:MAG: helix-hairpin-helix domain-containing protein [Desulfobacca sp.]|nr:helix-hairpin-helix domain-containing protein [Desulfobacca sp.]
MNVNPISPQTRLTYSQQGVILLLGTVLLGLVLARYGLGRVARAPSPPVKLYWVEISGAVSRPGVYSFSHPPELHYLWARAGGPGSPPVFTSPLMSGSRIMVAADGALRQDRMSGAKLLVLGLALDLNQARASDLEAIPGIGPVLAERIIQYRDTHGPFMQIEELSKIKGIGAKNLATIREHLILNIAKEEN